MWRGWLLALVLLVQPAFAAELVDARGFWEQTRLMHLSLGGAQSDQVRSASNEGFELSGGEEFDLKPWYSPRFPNLSAVFQTDLDDEMTVFWGGSFGEVGKKYRIGPRVNFGVQMRKALGTFSGIRVQLMGSYGGAMHEQTCVGDYGALGGIMDVNCRLAASILSPEQTLEFLWNSPPKLTAEIGVTYEWVF